MWFSCCSEHNEEEVLYESDHGSDLPRVLFSANQMRNLSAEIFFSAWCCLVEPQERLAFPDQ